MADTLSASVWFWVPVWSAGLFVLGALRLSKRYRTRGRVVALWGLAAVAIIPVLPVIIARQPQEPPIQVIYRFDDHRWLELKGWDCEGAVWYVDARHQIRTEVVSQFYRIFFFKYIHQSERYIAIPFQDMSAIMVSRDGGRTFGPDAAIYWDDLAAKPYDHRPTPEEVTQFVVVDDRGYIQTNNGRLLQSSLPIGDHWGMSYIDYLNPGMKVSFTDYAKPEFQDMKSKIPEVKNYTGWTHMKCNPDAGVVPPKTSLSGIPGLIYSVKAYTIAAPVYFGLRTH
ncbi:hypothetical protein KDX01_27065 [Burkholderia vietnamiensis]|uniref:T6SS immunity protein Tli3 family protein n=1 Tax=Burkholderia vietnamiensis TaxID=60552 RepID=UPI001B9BAF27|nr:hypothetical protein [Burkholderia vietnamiensis]MBR7976764.1 hypothetical protein [Burkholderia vietnamiensis]